jgi:transposase
MPSSFEFGRKMLILPKRIPEETRERAVRLVLDHLDEYPNLTAACETVSARLGFGAESLRRWVRQTQIDDGQRDGVTTVDAEELKRLRRENRELREANAILKDAAVFFAGELDPRRRCSSRLSTNNGARIARSSRSARSCESRAFRSPREPIGPGKPPRRQPGIVPTRS